MQHGIVETIQDIPYPVSVSVFRIVVVQDNLEILSYNYVVDTWKIAADRALILVETKNSTASLLIVARRLLLALCHLCTTCIATTRPLSRQSPFASVQIR